MRGVSKKGEGVGRKGIACNQLQSQTFYRTPFAHERGAIVQCHWLLPLERRKRDPGNEVGVKLVRAQRKMTHEKIGEKRNARRRFWHQASLRRFSRCAVTDCTLGRDLIFFAHDVIATSLQETQIA